MSRVVICLLFVLAAVAICTGGRRFNFNFKPEPPRHRIEVQAEGGGKGRGNYNVDVGARGEYDLHRSDNGAKIVGYAEGSANFGRQDGHSYRGKPEGEAGVRVEIPIGVAMFGKHYFTSAAAQISFLGYVIDFSKETQTAGIALTVSRWCSYDIERAPA